MFHFNLRSFEICKNIRLVLRLHSLMLPKIFNIYVKIYFKHVCIFSFVFNLFPQIKNWGMFSLSRFV